VYLFLDLPIVLKIVNLFCRGAQGKEGVVRFLFNRQVVQLDGAENRFGR